MGDQFENLIKGENHINILIDNIGFGKYHCCLITTFLVILFSLGRQNCISTLIIFNLQNQWNLSSFEAGTIAASSYVGIGIGFIICLFLEHFKGRMISIKVGTLIVLIVQPFLASMVQTWGFSVLRLIVGIGNGMYYGFIFTVSGECTPTKYRGLASLMIGSGDSLGFFITACAVWIFIPDLQDGNWRWPVLFPIIILVPFAALLFFYLVESPLYLARQGRTEEAIKNLNWIAYVNGVPGLSDQDEKHIRNMKKIEKTSLSQKFFQFFNEKHLKLTGIIFSITIWSLFTYYFVIFIIPYLLKEEGASSQSIIGYYLGLTSLIVMGSVASSALVETEFFGRKRLLKIYGFIVLGLSFVCILLGNSYAIAGVLVVGGVFQTNFLDLAYLINLELFDTALRGTSLILANVIGHLVSSFSLYLVLVLIEAAIWSPFVLIAGVVIGVLVLVSLIPIETRGEVLDTYIN